MRENKWREDAQPEWPDAASGTREFPATGAGAQAFPETRGTEVLASADETDVLPKASPRPESEPASSGPAFRDPWGPEGTADPAAGNAHDPHEVTVQLDAVSLRADQRLVGQAGGGAGGDADGSDGPVFVDESGRRSRRFRRIGIFVGIACAIYAVVIVATMLSGNSNAPWLPVPGQEGKEAGQVETTPLPADSAAPTDATGVTPGASPTLSDGTTPSPGVSATAPGASATATTPGASADPKPTATRTATSPVTNPSVSAKPTDEPTTSSPNPSVTPPTTPPGPSDSPAGGSAGTGTDNLADGADSAPGLSTAPSLENTL
ncbi:hypothetical protein [Streptomyces justiciae]|uniref:hypothetical protein n=1 Tax=Streptomyces justiciae TaxID=2780140 RepID=UPI0021185211|nr:hypothetical protein [Streptomyces justiciae]MCW8381651.1 hypothetical protein [Streptomyces justiciae]